MRELSENLVRSGIGRTSEAIILWDFLFIYWGPDHTLLVGAAFSAIGGRFNAYYWGFRINGQ